MKRLRHRDSAIDGVDVRLLRALESNGRLPHAELARLVGMSAPSVAERLRRLEDTGVIRRYTVEIDPASIGYPITAHIRIQPMPGQVKKIAALLAELPEIVECDRITGDDCFVARAHVRSVAHLERLIYRIAPNGRTNTAIVQSSPVPRRLPPTP